MDNKDDKLGLADAKSSSNTEIAEENPNVSQNGEQQDEGEDDNTLPRQQQSSSRTPFTNLSQVDADLALARTLQEQERAYMMLRFNNSINNNETGSDYGSWESGSYLHEDDADFGDPDDHDHHHHDDETDGDEEEEEDDEDEDEDEDEDAFDVHAHAELEAEPIIEIDPAMYSSDEAYARALQDAEEREMAARLLAFAGIHDHDEVEDAEDHGGNSQDAWEEVDPDELSYEELLALGEVVGNESRGLSADTIATLPSVNYKTGSNQNGSNDSCVICRIDYEDGETLTLLSCKHSYHSECINNWLKINKVCPVCSTEVSTSGHS